MERLLEKRYHSHIETAFAYEMLSPLKLLTWNRLDLAIKIAYLEHLNLEVKIFPDAYREHIKAFTLGTFLEPGNASKNSIEKYMKDFSAILSNMNQQGFDAKVSLVPLANDGSILNGAHRVAAAISLNKPISVAQLDVDPVIYDWRYFRERGLPQAYIELAAVEFIRRAAGTQLALLWPRSRAAHDQISALFTNVVLQKDIRLSVRGIHNLLSICYKNQSWLGDRQRDYPGIKNKLAEIYASPGDMRVIAFQAYCGEGVLKLKEDARSLLDIGKHSIHITDSSEEAGELAQLLFNDNGLHFLNYAHPNKYSTLSEKIDSLISFAHNAGLSLDTLVVDSSLLLELYGLRMANDIDILINDSCISTSYGSLRIGSHDEAIKYHRNSKLALIYDSRHHFTYKGVKFVGFQDLQSFKRRRAEEKDKCDLRLMSAIQERRLLKKCFIRLASKAFYLRAKARRGAPALIRDLAKRVGMYEALRALKRKL